MELTEYGIGLGPAARLWPAPDQSDAAAPDAPLSILVVDDEPPIVRELCDGLAAAGFVAEGAGTASEALRHLLRRHGRVGVVVADLRMPGADGLALTRRIMQEAEEHEAVEVVLLTGHGSLEIAAQAIREGAADLMLKPVRLGQAVAAVRRAMERAAARRATARQREAMRLRLDRLLSERDTLAGRLDAALGRAGEDGVDAGAEERKRRARERSSLLSHAIRTPLAEVIGYADLIEARSDDPPEQVARFAQEIRRAAERLLGGATLLLDYQLLLHVPEALNRLPGMPVFPLLAEARRRALLASRRRADAVSGPDRREWTIAADMPRLTEAVAQLLGNALRHAPSGEPVALTADDDGGALRLAVRDRGPGLPPEVLARLGEPFAVAEPVRLRSHDGPGIGLAYARLVAERHGGRLEAASRRGGGAEVALVLPFR